MRRCVWVAISVLTGGALMQSSICAQQCTTPSTGANFDDKSAALIYVDAASGLDSANCGDRSRPCKTISQSLSQAVNHEVADVIVNPGTYRETIALPSQFGESSSRKLLIEAAQAGTAVIDGADRWTGWVSNGDGTFSLPWSYAWGYAPQPFMISGGPRVGCLGLRREMVFIDGFQLTEVLQGPLTQAGTFRVVDGQSDSNSGDSCPSLSAEPHTITVRPPAVTTMSNADVELAVRRNLFSTSAAGAQNLELEGLVFQHDNNGVNISGDAAIHISGNNADGQGANILLDGVTARYNNWQGLDISANLDITIRNSTFTRNGENGAEIYRPLNFLFIGNSVTYNNWRGAEGGLAGWDADGMKVVKAHLMEVDDSSFSNNFSGGLWFDTDNEMLCLSRDSFNQNATNGLYFEATQGPALIYQSVFYGNRGHGLQTADSTGITVRQNTIFDNAADALFIGGSANVRSVSNWQKPGVQYELLTQNWVLDGNNISAGSETIAGSNLIGTSLGTINPFTSTLISNYNNWYAPNNSAPFDVPGQGNLTLGAWQNYTGQDGNSTHDAVISDVLPDTPICIGFDCDAKRPSMGRPVRP